MAQDALRVILKCWGLDPTECMGNVMSRYITGATDRKGPRYLPYLLADAPAEINACLRIQTRGGGRRDQNAAPALLRKPG